MKWAPRLPICDRRAGPLCFGFHIPIMILLRAFGCILFLVTALAAFSSRPNILVAISDDQSWLHASAMGDPTVRTPAFDQVAASGVLFTHAFTSAPSCTPSRAARLTGQHHCRLGAGVNLHSMLGAEFPVYPDLLENVGYHVGFTGKGWGPGDKTVGGGRTRNPAGDEYSQLRYAKTALLRSGISRIN